MDTQKTIIYFDGACHLCSREIDMYRKKDSNRRLAFVDISSSQFDASAEGLDPDDVHVNLHVKDTQGRILKGVEGFQKIWDELQIFRPLSWAYNQPLGRAAMNAGYTLFTRVRPMLPKKNCDSGSCSIR